MEWKKFLSYRHHNLSPLHHYQIGTIFLFVFGFFLFFPFYLAIEELKLDILNWQWYFFWPWMTFYITYCLHMRSKVPKDEAKNPLKRPIGHWVLLGLVELTMYMQPTNLRNLQAIDIAFLILTVFVADGYWDFKKIIRTNK